MATAVKTVTQSLSENNGSFVFDFSDVGKTVLSYVVGVAYWSFHFSDTDHRITTIKLSGLTAGTVNGARISITPMAKLYGQGEDLNKADSTLSLCCIAVLDGADNNVTVAPWPNPIPDDNSSGSIAVTTAPPGVLSAILSGWNLEYGNRHHVKDIRLTAAVATQSASEVCIKATAVMEDNSNNKASIHTIDAGVIKIGQIEQAVLTGQLVTGLQSDTYEKVPFGQKLNSAAVFLQDFCVSYGGSTDHDVRTVGGGVPNFYLSDDRMTVVLESPQAFIRDGGDHKNHQSDGRSFVSLLVIGVA